MTTASSVQRCTDCGADVAPGLLACPGCARLVHGRTLSELAQKAESAEREGDMAGALGHWRRTLDLLPPGTVQRTTIEKRMKALSAAVDGRGERPANVGSKGKAGTAAGVGAVGLALLKSKAFLLAVLSNGKLLLIGLTKLPTLVSMLLYFRFAGGRGALMGLGIVASIYVHEVGHVAALRRYGIEASAPMFIPGFGAVVRMKQYPTDAHEEARTGLAGPLWGLCAAVVAALLGFVFDSRVCFGVASVGASINLFNLIAVWQLDGARGSKALSKGERWAVAGLAVVTALATAEWMPLAVGVAMLVRALGRDVHASGDRRMFGLFACLIVALSIVARLPVPSVPHAD